MRLPVLAGDWPVSQHFGINPAYYADYGYPGHNGLDLACPVGTQVLLPVDAVLIEVGFDAGGYGLYQKWETADGQDWLFAHLQSSQASKQGDRAVGGTPIALSGASGRVTGPHLHVGYRPLSSLRGWPWDGWVDPLPFVLRVPLGAGEPVPVGG